MTHLLHQHDLTDITVVETLPEVTQAERARLLAAPRNAQEHQAMLAETPAMRMVQTGGAATAAVADPAT